MKNDHLLKSCAECGADLEEGGYPFLGSFLCGRCYEVMTEEAANKNTLGLILKKPKKETWN